jgi:hypothetical protein
MFRLLDCGEQVYVMVYVRLLLHLHDLSPKLKVQTLGNGSRLLHDSRLSFSLSMHKEKMSKELFLLEEAERSSRQLIQY